MFSSKFQTILVRYSRCRSRNPNKQVLLVVLASKKANFSPVSVSVFTTPSTTTVTGGYNRLLPISKSHSQVSKSHRLFFLSSKTTNKPLVFPKTAYIKVFNSAAHRRYYCSSAGGMELQQIVANLKTHAPTSLGQSWDNVGLLVEPSSPHIVKTLFLTNDLTPPVLDEAIERKADMILSYHPPIFSAMKKLRQSVWKERLMIKCIENKIAVYSPHTCFDAKSAGVNDWLISAFDIQESTPVENSEESPGKLTHKINIICTGDNSLTSAINSLDVKVTSSDVLSSSSESMKLFTVLCTNSDIPDILKAVESSTCQIDSLDVVKLEKVPKIGFGCGRVGQLKTPITLSEAVDRVKTHLQLKHIRLAAKSSNKPIKSVAVCAGSGSSVLCGVRADLYVTGEMSHHDVLDAVYNGANVILCEHSNTERGYLKQVKEELYGSLPDVSIVISDTDSDPLHVV